ncbi:MAG: hypothetical protein WCH77_13725 [Planctomycetota bacterium]
MDLGITRKSGFFGLGKQHFTEEQIAFAWRHPGRLDGRHPAVLDVIASRLAAVVTAP